MSLHQITSTYFKTVLDRLGVKPGPREGFGLVNSVQPVALVDVDVSIPVISSQVVFAGPFSIGHQLGPAVNTVLADTNQLAAGTWQFCVTVNIQDGAAAGGRAALQHRDAANAANIWERNYYVIGPSGNIDSVWVFTKSVALNERLRVIVLGSPAGGSFYNANIFANQIA